MWFSDSSFGKESTCNAGDPGSIPVSGISAGEGIGSPLQSSLVSQLVENQSAMLRTRVWSLGWEDTLENGKTTYSIKAWRIPWTVYKESNMTEWFSLLQFFKQIFWSWIINEWASQVVLMVKNLSASAGNVRNSGLIPGSGRSPGGLHGNPLQYSWLDNPMDRGTWWATVHRVTKSQTWLKQLSTMVV